VKAKVDDAKLFGIAFEKKQITKKESMVGRGGFEKRGLFKQLVT